jgi:hypothetical protein
VTSLGDNLACTITYIFNVRMVVFYFVALVTRTIKQATSIPTIHVVLFPFSYLRVSLFHCSVVFPSHGNRQKIVCVFPPPIHLVNICGQHMRQEGPIQFSFIVVYLFFCSYSFTLSVCLSVSLSLSLSLSHSLTHSSVQ